MSNEGCSPNALGVLNAEPQSSAQCSTATDCLQASAADTDILSRHLDTCSIALLMRSLARMQDVLAKVGGGAAMTIAEATMIADNALEHTVRSLLAALQAPEILKSTQGAPFWLLSLDLNHAGPSEP